ncbi:hypothetical protein Bbelb_278190 [Branchiostoma belcheri]|nr:hypothetical protein Bbelb_278190 [Branchiostoma belcheri]
MDGTYNNPSYHSYTHNATQVTVPVIETYTGQNMLIDFQYANKLCSCKKEEVDRGNHGPSCTANFPLANPIGNAEGELARRAVVDMQGDPQNPVLLDNVLTDNDSYTALNSKRKYLREKWNECIQKFCNGELMLPHTMIKICNGPDVISQIGLSMQEPREVEARAWEDRDSRPPYIPPQQNTAEDMTPEEEDNLEEPDIRKGSQNETTPYTSDSEEEVPFIKRPVKFTRTEEHEDIQDHSNETSSSSRCTYKTTLCQNLQGILGECSSLKDLDEARQKFKLRPSLKEYATQVSVPVIETYTGQNMLIDFQNANKLCSCKKEEVDRGNHGPSCTASFPLADSIGNAEEKLARRAVVDMQGTEVHQMILTVVLKKDRIADIKKLSSEPQTSCLEGSARRSTTGTKR